VAAERRQRPVPGVGGAHRSHPAVILPVLLARALSGAYRTPRCPARASRLSRSGTIGRPPGTIGHDRLDGSSNPPARTPASGLYRRSSPAAVRPARRCRRPLRARCSTRWPCGRAGGQYPRSQLVAGTCPAEFSCRLST
jgi:hypothetical protein